VAAVHAVSCCLPVRRNGGRSYAPSARSRARESDEAQPREVK
jgi:hypothetical protein